VPEPLPKRLLYVEPLRRRMRVRFGGIWIADSEHVLLLFEPGRYPVAYFPETDVFSTHPGTHRPYYPTPRSRAHVLVQRPGGRATHRAASGVAAHIVSVHLDGTQLHLEPGQTVVPHGPDRNLTVTEVVRPANH
jgi:hypothetical protein